MKKSILTKIVLGSMVAWSLSASFAYADTKVQLERRIVDAKQVMSEVMGIPDQSIPEELLAKCKAVAIYPSVLKVGFIFGGRFGKGVVLRRDEQTGQWGAVAFSTIGGGSWGLQIGGQATDLVLVLMNERGLDGLLNSKFTLGTDVSVAAGPVGRGTQAATDLSLQAGILSYSRSRGLFAGLALDGSVVTQDNGSNTEYYGTAINSREILFDRNVSVQPSSKILVEALNEYSARWGKRSHAAR